MRRKCVGIHACRIELTAVQRRLIHFAAHRLIVRILTMAAARCASARRGRRAAPRSWLATSVTPESDKNAARDSTCSTRRPISFGYLEVQADPFTIDENEARLDQLLAGGIEVRVSA